jgi:hypothetical protein
MRYLCGPIRARGLGWDRSIRGHLRVASQLNEWAIIIRLKSSALNAPVPENRLSFNIDLRIACSRPMPVVRRGLCPVSVRQVEACVLALSVVAEVVSR